jgi:predicted transcriptional regulator
MKNGRPYRDESLIPIILRLRKCGFNYTFIAEMVGLCRTTVMYHCDKAGLPKGYLPPKTSKQKEEMRRLCFSTPHKIIAEIKISKPVTYRDYVNKQIKDSRERKKILKAYESAK